MDRRRAQKTKSEYEHASEIAPEKKQDHMRNGGRQVWKIDGKCSLEGGPAEGPKWGPGGLEAAFGRHVPPKWAPGAVQVAPGGGPGGSKNSFGGPGPPRGDKLIDFRVPGGSPEAPGTAPERAVDKFSSFFLAEKANNLF